MRESDGIATTNVHFAVMTAVAKSKRGFLHNVKTEASKIMGRYVHTAEVRDTFLVAGEDLATSLAGTARSRAHSASPSVRTDRDLDLELELAQMRRIAEEERRSGRELNENHEESASIESSGSGLSEQEEELPHPVEPSSSNLEQKVASAPSCPVLSSFAPAPFGASTYLWSETRSSRRGFMEHMRTDLQRGVDEGRRGSVDTDISRNIPSTFGHWANHLSRQRTNFQEAASSFNLFGNSGLRRQSTSDENQPQMMGSFAGSSTSRLFSNPGYISLSALLNEALIQPPVSPQPPSESTSPASNNCLATANDSYAKEERPYGYHFPVYVSCVLQNGFYIIPTDDSKATQIKAEITSWMESVRNSLHELTEKELEHGLPVLYLGNGEETLRAVIIKPRGGERTKVRCVDTGVSHHARPHELRPIAAALVNKFPAQAQLCSLDVPEYFRAEWPLKILSTLRKGVHSKNEYTCIHFSYYQDENSVEWAMVDLKGARESLKDYFLQNAAS